MKYCFLEPDFPEVLYVANIFFVKHGKINLLPFDKAFPTVEEICPLFQDIDKECKSKNNGIDIPEYCSLLKLKFNSFYPLRKEFWMNPNTPFGLFDKIELFVQLVANPTLFTMLVVPNFYYSKERKLRFDAPLPVKIGTSKKVIEQFMLNSDVTVDQRAKNAAIYLVGEPLKLDWINCRVEIVETKRKRLGRN